MPGVKVTTTESKAWWKSRGIWGAIFAGLAGGGALWGFEIPEPDLAATADQADQLAQAIIAKDLVGALALLGSFLALIGRILSTGAISRDGSGGPIVRIIQAITSMIGGKVPPVPPAAAVLFLLFASIAVSASACTAIEHGAVQAVTDDGIRGARALSDARTEIAVASLGGIAVASANRKLSPEQRVCLDVFFPPLGETPKTMFRRGLLTVIPSSAELDRDRALGERIATALSAGGG